MFCFVHCLRLVCGVCIYVVHGGNGVGCEGQAFQSQLAGFLIGVEELMWFMCSKANYYVSDNAQWFDEYSRPLGEPLQKAVTVGDIWVREFAYGTIAIYNQTSNVGDIHWGDSMHIWQYNQTVVYLRNAFRNYHSISISISSSS